MERVERGGAERGGAGRSGAGGAGGAGRSGVDGAAPACLRGGLWQGPRVPFGLPVQGSTVDGPPPSLHPVPADRTNHACAARVALSTP